MVRWRLAVALLSALAALSVGCGSTSDDSTSDGGGSTVPTAEFTGNGNNGPASFGRVADEEEREAASAVLEENLKARAAGDFAGQCATLTADSQGRSEAYAPGKCAKGLKIQAEPLSQSEDVRENSLTGPIDVLRVKGKFGYALYHGTKGQDYAMLMKKENGEWKVARLSTNEIP